MTVIRRQSDHFEERFGNIQPDCIVLHNTETSFKEADAAYTGESVNPEFGRLSTHYMVDEGGSIYQYVDEKSCAWHAGKSYWGGETDMNSHSIGIELVNSGMEPFETSQINSAIELCKEVAQRNKINPFRIFGHADISPGRKIDPSFYFPWKILSEAGVGVWPAPEARHYKSAKEIMGSADEIKALFISYGYNPDIELPVLTQAFHLRYQPHLFLRAGEPHIYTKETVAMLLFLNEKKALQSGV